MKHFLLLANLLLFGSSLWAQPTAIWQPVLNEAVLAAKGGVRQIVPQQYRTVALQPKALQQVLANAPVESVANSTSVSLQLPLPDGSMQTFAVRQSPIMEAGLAAKFPNLRTYNGQGVDDRTATVRFGWTEKGFHAIILSAKGTYFIDPYSVGDTLHYLVYDKKDFVSTKTYECLHHSAAALPLPAPKGSNGLLKLPSGGELRTYRLALACTGEYTQFHGGTVSGALSAVVVSVNRINAIYEREVAIRLVLVANNNLLIYTSGSSDPYNNNSGSTMLGQNQTNVNNIIGSANYDIGHVFSTGGGGVAILGSVCVKSNKARGVTGSPSPVGDPFDVDYVAHEMGHQFGAEHTFNGNKGSCSGGNRSAGSAYEPGSGTSIMGYAGICGANDIAPHSDPYFHSRSFDQIVAFSQTANGNVCAVKTSTGNNYPNVTAGTGGYVIPANTPFELVGNATDPDGDLLTFSWEQMDLGPAGAPNTPSGNAPLFRFFPPKSEPRRTFPQETDLLNNTQTIGEILPTYSRNLKFRLVARDNRAGGGGVNYADIAFSVTANAGPFLVKNPNTSAVVWSEGATTSITWDVANTNIAPVNCSHVRILLSTDGGYTYPFVLANSVPNNGAAVVTVPTGTATSMARVRVQCATGTFFDVSNENFDITALPHTIYVNASVVGGANNGTNWANAYTDLQSAIDAAQTGDSVWVAAGIYKPNAHPTGCSNCTSNRDYAFAVEKNIKLYGGFAGTETQFSQRNYATHQTILSGDFNGDDTSGFANNDENAYHVIITANLTSAVIDGFTIANGNADGSGAITYSNRSFYRNFGGGQANNFSSPTMTNCNFMNSNAIYGGGQSNTSSSPVLTNCAFTYNTSSYGGGQFNYTSSLPNVVNCTFAYNTASSTGGGQFNHLSSAPTVVNTIFWGNVQANSSAIIGADIQNGSASSAAVSYCLTQQNSNYSSGTGIINNQNPLFVSATNFAIQAGSPAINTGNSSYNSTTTDLGSKTRVQGNSVDMGAYEWGSCQTDTVVLYTITCLPANAGVQTAILTNQYGCDSVVITNNVFLGPTLTDVAWKKNAKVTIFGTTISKSNGSSTSWDAGSNGGSTLLANNNGWVVTTILETNTERVIGLAKPNTSAGKTNIDYGIQLFATGKYRIIENNVLKTANKTYYANDVFKIDRTNSVVKYYHNGTLIYTSAAVSTTDLITDAAFKTIGATLYEVKEAFVCSGANRPKPTNKVVEKTEENPTFGTFPNVTIYPNPANAELYIALEKVMVDEVHIAIFAATGQLVESRTTTDTNTHFSTASWANGLYFVKISTGEHTSSQKVLIQH